VPHTPAHRRTGLALVEPPGVSRRGRAAFTLVELLVVSILTMALTLVIAQVWRFLSVDMTDLMARSRVGQELRVATETLAEDFGPAVGVTCVTDQRVLICKDGGASPNGIADWADPDVTIEYYLGDAKLQRVDQSTGAELVIAEDVVTFSVTELAESILRIVVGIERAGLARQVTLMWSMP